MPDVLLEVSRMMARPLAPAFTWQTFDEMLMETFAGLAPRSSDDAWSTAQQQGGWWSEGVSAAPIKDVPKPSAYRYADPMFDGDLAAYPFHFVPYPSQAFLDGSLAHLPWLQELPDVMSTAMWSTWVEVNPRTAANLGIAE